METRFSSPPPHPAGWQRFLACGSVAGLLLLILILGLMPGRYHSQLAETVQTLGHFGFFGLLALITAMGLPVVLPRVFTRPWQATGVAIGISILLGGMLEVLQSMTPTRSPSWNDLQHDALGALAGASLLTLVDRPRRQDRVGRFLARIAFPLLLSTLALGLWPLYRCGRDYLARAHDFPVLHRYDAAWSERFRWQDSAVLTLPTELPTTWPPDRSTNVRRVRIEGSAPYPGLGFKEPQPNWSEYTYLTFDLYSFAATPTPLAIRIHDFQHASKLYKTRRDDHYDRFNRVLEIAPGFQTVQIAVADIASGPRSRRLDLTNVEGLKLFAINPREPWEIVVGNFRLTK